MKMIYILLIIPHLIYAPYEIEYYIRGKKINKAFMFDTKTKLFYTKSCVHDTCHPHGQPERSKRRNLVFTRMRCSELHRNMKRDK
jgi:hypothetical protein